MRANGGSWYAMPFRIEPERGQVPENSTKPRPGSVGGSSKEICDVLHEEEPRSKLDSKAGDFRPKAGSPTVKASALSGGADVLAREPSADDVNGNSIGSKPLGGEVSDVMVDGNSGPMLGEHPARELFDFAEGDGLETAGALQA